MSEQETILSSLRNKDLKTVKGESEKNKRIIKTCLSEQHNGIKRINLCWSEISQR